MGLCINGSRRWWAGIDAPQLGAGGEQRTAGEAQGPQRGTLKAQGNGPDTARVSQHSAEHTANTLDGSCYFSKPVVNKWSLLALIVEEPQASKPPGALQL